MPARRHIRARPIALLASCALAIVALAVPVAAEAAVKFKIRGAGWGHGIGMSQWGARGLAKQGWSHRRILGHYYRRTKVGETSRDRIRVLLTSGGKSASFSGVKRACRRTLRPDKTYRATRKRGRVKLERRSGRRIAWCGKVLRARGPGPIEIGGEGTYRGQLIARVASSGGLHVINRVSIEGYVRGVVPVEMPSSWPGRALRAQAVAARSFGLATGVRGEGFDQYDDTRSQVYGGRSVETGRTNRAVRKTRRQVVTHRGKVSATYYFSTSGGRTEAIQNAWPGASAQPYLKSVRSRYEKASPYHRWRLTMSRRRMEARLGSLVKGRLRRIKVIERGDSPRIVRARVIGSNGKTRVTGPTLQSALGTRSTWMRFEKVRR